MQGGQQRGPINGLDPLIYTGGLPNLVVMGREPTPKDYQGFFLGHWWIVPQSSNDLSPTEEVWVLVSKRNNIAKWKRLHGGSGPVAQVIIGNQILTTPGAGTYTPTLGMKQVYVECIGGGGGGFAGSNVGSSQSPRGGGGGGYSAKLYTSGDIGTSQPYFIGSGGAGTAYGAVAPGNNGQDTTFGTGSTLITAQGGKSAVIIATIAGSNFYNSFGGNGIGGDINIQGGTAGTSGSDFNVSSSLKGGDSQYGIGGFSYFNSSGTNISENGHLYGGGGGVGVSVAGGNGAQGMIKITEYFA